MSKRGICKPLSGWKEGTIHKGTGLHLVSTTDHEKDKTSIAETRDFFCLFLPFFRYFLQTQQYGGWWKKEKDDQRREEGKGVRVRGPVKAGKIISGHILGEILLLSPSKLIKRHAFWAEGGGRGRNAALLPWEWWNLRLSGEKLMSESSEMHDYILHHFDLRAVFIKSQPRLLLIPKQREGKWRACPPRKAKQQNQYSIFFSVGTDYCCLLAKNSISSLIHI